MPQKIEALEGDVVLGDFVQTKMHGQRGRVYKIHVGCPESRGWFAALVPPMDDEVYDEGRWLSILCHNGGAVVRPDFDCEVIEPIEGFTNVWSNFYFGKAEAMPTETTTERFLVYIEETDGDTFHSFNGTREWDLERGILVCRGVLLNGSPMDRGPDRVVEFPAARVLRVVVRPPESV